MLTTKQIGVFVLFISCLYAGDRDVRVTYDWLKQGSAITADEAEKLERRLENKPTDDKARIELLSYYATSRSGINVDAVRTARAKHIFWLIENDPKTGLGLFQIATGVYRLHCTGDELADPEAFQHAAALWLEQLQKNPGSAEIRREAVDAIQYCSPDRAETILINANDRAALGRLYAGAVLGITGESYTSNDPAGSDPKYRERPFAEKAQRALETATDAPFLAGAAATLLRDGAILWADGKLDWDYTTMGNALLAKARQENPDNMLLLTLPTALPARGERPPMTIRVGGNVQAANLIRKVVPRYPPSARAAGISGTVRMTALIGLDGAILYLHPDSGPAELMAVSLDAVRQWRYRPTLLNGRPCYVITLIDVNYTMH